MTTDFPLFAFNGGSRDGLHVRVPVGMTHVRVAKTRNPLEPLEIIETYVMREFMVEDPDRQTGWSWIEYHLC